MSIEARPQPSGAAQHGSDPGLERILSTGGLVAFGLAYLVPLTVFTTLGAVTRLTQGHLPMAYLVTTLAMLFTAASYAHLVRAFPSAGSAYAYARGIFGEHAGFVVGWALLLDYLLLPAINYLVIAIYLHAQFPQLPQPALVMGTLFVVTILNVIGIGIVRNVSLALVGLQLAFAVVFGVEALAVHPAPRSLEPLYSSEVSWSTVFTGAAVLCLSFLGFDAVSTLSEEAHDPTRTVPRAILLTTFVGGVLFTVLAYAAASVIPDWHALEENSDAAALQVMHVLGTRGMTSFFLAAYIAGSLASAVAAQASVSRILFAIGRDGKLPKPCFGVLNRHFGTPVRAIVIVALLSTVVLAISLDTLASIISFGALSAFTVVNLAVIKHFLFDARRRRPRDYLLYGVFPCAGVAATAWLWASLSRMALIVGLCWLALGVIYLLGAVSRTASMGMR
jgi:putrescine importer